MFCAGDESRGWAADVMILIRFLTHEPQEQQSGEKYSNGHPKMNIGEHVAQPTRTCFLVPDRFHFGSAMWAASALSQGSLMIFALGGSRGLFAFVSFPSLSNDVGVDGVGFG